MVNHPKQNTVKPLENQGKTQGLSKAAKIGPDTRYELCSTSMTAFGGLLGLVKFLDFVKFRDIFHEYYCSPSRRTKLGCYSMVLGIIMLLFIGFPRLGHFEYIRRDRMVCGILNISLLPAVSTFWRYLRSVCLNQSRALLNISALLRSRVWQACELGYTSVCIDIDTTVSTVYGEIEGSRKGHNTKHRGKKGLRPVLLFIEETREYICGTQRRGTTMKDEEVAELILAIGKYLPTSVKHVIIRGDAEFIGGLTIAACRRCGYDFIFANKNCAASFDEQGWYQVGNNYYNETCYTPKGWDAECRFVVMRIPKDKDDDTADGEQLSLFDNAEYKHRVFATSLEWKAHSVTKKYDKRADVENCINEAQSEGILAIPSKRFLSNHVFFQIVMLSYNIWRWMKLMAGKQVEDQPHRAPSLKPEIPPNIVDHKIRIARLKMLFLPAKISKSRRISKVKYSVHDERSAGLLKFLSYLDRQRKRGIEWHNNVLLGGYRVPRLA